MAGNGGQHSGVASIGSQITLPPDEKLWVRQVLEVKSNGGID